MVIHRYPAEVEESKGSFHPRTVRTLQKSPKFRSLLNQLGFGPKARRIATKSLMSIATDSGVKCFAAESHRLIPSTYHQCVKGRLNGRPIRIPANPNPFSQGEVNFVETIFCDELGLGTLGAPVLEEEGGGGTHDLRNLLDSKRQKKETNFLGSQECVVVWKSERRLIYRL